MGHDPKDVVTKFCEAWERRNVDDVLDFLAPDIVYQNVPLPVMHGRDEAAQFLAPLLKHATRIEFIMLSIAASGEQVLTERLDRLHFPAGIVDIPLMGIFVVREGKIKEWRDYTDNITAMEAFKKAGIDLSKADLGLSS